MVPSSPSFPRFLWPSPGLTRREKAYYTVLHSTQRKGRLSQAGERRGEGINRPRNGWLLFHYIAPLPSQLKPRPWLEVVSIDDAPAVYKRTQLVCWESEEGFLRTRELR